MIHEVDLDVSYLSTVKFDIVDREVWDRSAEADSSLCTESFLLWVAALLKFALNQGAIKIELKRDRELRLICQQLVVVDAKSRERRLELVPLPWTPHDRTLKKFRLLCRLIVGRNKGTLRYRLDGTKKRVRVSQLSDDEYVVFLK